MFVNLEINHFQDFVEYTTLSSDTSLQKSLIKWEEMLLIGLYKTPLNIPLVLPLFLSVIGIYL